MADKEISEVKELPVISKHRKSANREKRKIDKWNRWAWLFSLALIGTLFYLFYTLLQNPEDEEPYTHEILGAYGDIVGGVLGSLVALFSAYLLVRTFRNQLDVNSSVMDSNESMSATNSVLIYQSYLGIFDNKFQTFLKSYTEAVSAYRFTKDRGSGKDDKTDPSDEKDVLVGRLALEALADKFARIDFSDGRTYLSRVKKATNAFDEFYSENRHVMSVHFRTLYLLAKFVGEMSNYDDNGFQMFTELDRLEYAKVLRGQLTDGEMLLLRYNCLTDRGAKMRPFVNQFNLTKHLPVMSLLEFRQYRDALDERDASTLDSHFISLRKWIKQFITECSNDLNMNYDMGIRHTLSIKIDEENKHITLSLTRLIKKPSTGSDGTPKLEEALNSFSDFSVVLDLYKDFMREVFLVSNFYSYNGKDETTVSNRTLASTKTQERGVVEVRSKYPLIIAPWQLENP